MTGRAGLSARFTPACSVDNDCGTFLSFLPLAVNTVSSQYNQQSVVSTFSSVNSNTVISQCSQKSIQSAAIQSAISSQQSIQSIANKVISHCSQQSIQSIANRVISHCSQQSIRLTAGPVCPHCPLEHCCGHRPLSA